MKPEDKDFLQRSRKQLDDSAEALDGATLSRLNQARQKALQNYPAGRRPWRLFNVPLPAGIMAGLSIAVVSGWLVLSQTPQTTPGPIASEQLVFNDEDLNMLSSDTELELLEQLEFVSWLLTEELDQNNAG